VRLSSLSSPSLDTQLTFSPSLTDPVHPNAHSSHSLTSRLDRIESLLLAHNNALPSPHQQAYVPAGRGMAGRPSTEGTVYEEDLSGVGEGQHNWKTKVVA
jgi:hypothetical protein